MGCMYEEGVGCRFDRMGSRADPQLERGGMGDQWVVLQVERGVDIMVASGGINLHCDPLMILKYSGSKKRSKCNPRRDVD
jgi:hypothetical protein